MFQRSERASERSDYLNNGQSSIARNDADVGGWEAPKVPSVAKLAKNIVCIVLSKSAFRVFECFLTHMNDGGVFNELV